MIKGRLHSSSYRMLGMSLLIIIFLSSCMQFGLFPNSLDAEEVPTPGSIDPEMEFSSKYLICPTVPNSSPIIPPGPYDEDLGDCALKGKSAEIEAWLTELEEIAAGCQANREPYWSDTLAARDLLDIKIDDLRVIEIEPIEFEGEEEPGEQEQNGSIFNSPGITENEDEIPISCQGYEREIYDDPTNEASPDRSHIFTAKLIRITNNVEKYCTMIDELIKPLWFGCDEINHYQDCQDPDLEQYHGVIEQRMIEAQSSYDFTDLFYAEYLMQSGWDDFRSEFSESSIYCPLDPAVDSMPEFEFAMNTFCRRGPSYQYRKVATFLEGQVAQIVGSNKDDLRWWWVTIPDSSDHCWVSDTTGSAEGALEDLEFVAAPPLLIGETCSSDLTESDCLAAGGTWAGKDTPSPYCDCP